MYATKIKGTLVMGRQTVKRPTATNSCSCLQSGHTFVSVFAYEVVIPADLHELLEDAAYCASGSGIVKSKPACRQPQGHTVKIFEARR